MTTTETPYVLPDGANVWVQPTAKAAEQLEGVLTRYRSGYTDALVFGDAGRPEAVIIRVDIWRALIAVATDEDGYDLSHLLVEPRRDTPELY